ncbi:MAG: phosphoribosylanthranilate isomerase [Pelagibacterales bacterium]|jgi:phosphoribosylanthranilate isomerase|nr:phosphoribosylanthranilate isomerase [Pelagibacterales bacterium]
MPIKLKICGINSAKTIQIILKNGGCQYLGFVFYPSSPRNLSIEQSQKLTSIVPSQIMKVAVLVDPENTLVERIKDQFDYFQIYNSSPSRIKSLKLLSNKKIIQAIKVKSEKDINLYKQYIGIADEFLFDSTAMEKSAIFNWDYLKNIKIKNWFLAGGININNIDEAVKITRKIDISSALEDNPGIKSEKKVFDFLEKVQTL